MKSVIFKNKWLSILKLNDPKLGEYIYSHETRCNGKIIAILPFRVTDKDLEFLLRDELTPCWETDKLVVSSITGGFENDITETVLHELTEEAGFTVDEGQLINLGTCRGTKSCDTIYHLFSVDLTNEKQKKPTTDGSYLEAQASCFWDSKIDKAEDPLVYVMYYRLLEYLNTIK